MGRRGWLNLVLLLVVIALAALVYVEPGKETGQLVTLTSVDTAAVQRITLERPAAETVVLQRQDGVWRMAEPVAVAARTFQVERLLEMLAQESQQQYPAQGLDLSKYGLQPPRARLVVDGVELAFGKINPLNSRLYVVADDVMHMVAQNDIALLTGGWSEFVSTALLPNEALVRLEVPGLGRIERGEDGWRYEGATAPDSADQMQALVDAWQHARALRVRPLQAADMSGEVVVQLVSGTDLRFALQSGDDALVLQRRDLGLEYVFDAAQVQRLLKWPPVVRMEDEIEGV